MVARRNRARSPAPAAPGSVRIDGGRTVVGCIRRRRRLDVWATDAASAPKTRAVSNRLKATMCSVPE